MLVKADNNWNDISTRGAAMVAELKVGNPGSGEDFCVLALIYSRMRDLKNI